MNLTLSLDYASGKFDAFDNYKIDNYLYGVGLCVNRKFRGRGIATELLKARAPFLKTLNLTVTTTLFTTIGSQKAAQTAGYQEKAATSYDEIQLKFPEMDFSKVNTTHCKIFALVVS